jgi:hypothetical protein
MTAFEDADDGRGAQVERTVLAWNRSAVAVAANGALMARTGFVRHVAALEWIGLAIVAAGAGLWLLSLARYSTLPSLRVPHLITGRAGPLVSFSAFVVLLSLADLAIVVDLR